MTKVTREGWINLRIKAVSIEQLGRRALDPDHSSLLPKNRVRDKDRMAIGYVNVQYQYRLTLRHSTSTFACSRKGLLHLAYVLLWYTAAHECFYTKTISCAMHGYSNRDLSPIASFMGSLVGASH